MAAEVAAGLLDLLFVFIIASSVGIFVAKIGHFPYAIALLLAGWPPRCRVDVEHSHDLILLVLLPPLLFEGAATRNSNSSDGTSALSWRWRYPDCYCR